MFKTVDLFSGAGGLSLGFMATGAFDIKVAFENNPAMQQTYRLNHTTTDVRGNVCDADYDQIRSEYGDIDIVIGGPPCQGFSNANRQKNHAISMNNLLVKEYIRAILELRPKAFIMENVSMLRSDVHRFFLVKGEEEFIEHYGIHAEKSVLHLLDAKFCFVGLDTIVESPELVNKYIWPEADYIQMNVIYKYSKNPSKIERTMNKHKRGLLKLAVKYLAEDYKGDAILTYVHEALSSIRNFYGGIADINDVVKSVEPVIMIQRMLSKCSELYSNNLVIDEFSYVDGVDVCLRSFAVYEYLKNILESDEFGYAIKDDILCAADFGAPQKRKRFVVMGIRKELAPEFSLPEALYSPDEYNTVYDAISDLQEIEPFFTVTDDEGCHIDKRSLNRKNPLYILRDSPVIKNHIMTKTTPTAMARFKSLHQGENFHSLDPELQKNTYTNVERTQNSIYQRLDYKKPSGTVTNVRKAMWIHPVKDRAISIREAARLQTFPDSFVFAGSKDEQYQQVGNAVPPIMAKAIAEKLLEYLK